MTIDHVLPIPLAKLASTFTRLINVPRRLDVRREGSDSASLYYLERGWACTSRVVITGDRQIIDVHLAGEIMGWSSIASSVAVDTITTITDCYLRTIDIANFKKLVSTDANYVDTMMRHLCVRNVAISDRLTSLGLSDAAGRVAAFICEIHSRVSGCGADILKFELCMSQPEIGEATGLTGVHINRVLRKLREANVMTMNKTQVSIDDLGTLRKIAMLPEKSCSYA